MRRRRDDHARAARDAIASRHATCASGEVQTRQCRRDRAIGSPSKRSFEARSRRRVLRPGRRRPFAAACFWTSAVRVNRATAAAQASALVAGSTTASTKPGGVGAEATACIIARISAGGRASSGIRNSRAARSRRPEPDAARVDRKRYRQHQRADDRQQPPEERRIEPIHARGPKHAQQRVRPVAPQRFAPRGFGVLARRRLPLDRPARQRRRRRTASGTACVSAPAAPRSASRRACSSTRRAPPP